jgi:hypothetical protein
MAESASAAVKVCTACSKDVTNLPRTKDGQGRYFCKTCVDKIKAKAKPAAAATGPIAVVDPAETDVMAKLLASSPGVELCPNCGGGINVGAKLCVRCGFNKETGKAMKVVVERAPKDKKEKSGRRGGTFVISEGLYLFLMIGLVGGGFALGMFNPAFIALLYVVSSIMFGVAWIWGIIAAFKDGESMAGLCGILGFVFLFSWLYFIYWCLTSWRGYLKMSMAAALVGIVASFIGFYGHFGGEDDELPHTRSTQRSRAAPSSADDETADTAPAKPENPTPSDGTVLGG